MKYFTITQIKEAIEHLSDFEGKWLIPSLVFACNGVNTNQLTNVRNLNGTDSFLDRFFSGALIGLPPLKSGANSLRPKFKDLQRTFAMEGKGEDYVIHQDTRLWANAYSRAGYRVMIDRGHVRGGAPSEFQLEPSFKQFFESIIPATFKMEHFLVWLYAFTGINEHITTWQELFIDFQETCLGQGQRFSAEYTERFKISDQPIAFPNDLLIEKPLDEEFQRELMPSSFVLSLTPQNFLDIKQSLVERFKSNFQGFSEGEIDRQCSDIVAALSATKRLFLLGEPGIGKTKLARLVIQAFRDVIGDERLFYADEPITDKTTPESLIGYGGITGEWIFGSLTAAKTDNTTLLASENEIINPNRRNQVNVILLDECNRRNIEALLSRFQNSMDSQSLDPKDISHSISLDASGKHYLSPNTYWIFTGNSPLNDQGRVPQSRPFKRRPNLVVVPNIVERLVADKTAQELATELSTFWKNHCQSGLIITTETSEALSNQLQNDAELAQDLKNLFTTLAIYEVGLSFGLLEKLFRTSASLLSLGYTFNEAIDSGFSSALSPLLSTDKLHEEKSLRTYMLEAHQEFEERYPSFWKTIMNVLDEGSEFGIVRPFF